MSLTLRLSRKALRKKSTRRMIDALLAQGYSLKVVR